MAYALVNPIQPKFILRNPQEAAEDYHSFQLIRCRDNESFLASPIPEKTVSDPKNPTWKSSLASVLLPIAGVPISRILNHPNLISLIDIIHTDSLAGSTVFKGKAANLAVFEDMDQGDLSLILPDEARLPSFGDFPAWRALATENPNRFSLPESLCWHVLESINKALLWLHEGVKATDFKNDWERHDDDWQPILIRDISPKQVFFKRPLLGTTYGACKLGGFQKAVVTGFPGGEAAYADKDTEHKRSRAYYWAPEIHKNMQPWSRAAEVYSLGAVLYTMMTGIPPPPPYEYHWQISRLNDKGYTIELTDIVSDMLKHRSDERPSTAQLVSRIENGKQSWRLTEDARGFVDYVDLVEEFQKEGGRQIVMDE